MTKEERLEQIKNKYLDFDSDDFDKEPVFVIGFVKKMSSTDKEVNLKNADFWAEYHGELLGFFDSEGSTYAVIVPINGELANEFVKCIQRANRDNCFNDKFKDVNNQPLEFNYSVITCCYD